MTNRPLAASAALAAALATLAVALPFTHSPERDAARLALPVALAAPQTSNGGGVSVPDARMLRYPDVGRDFIVFLFANDLWMVPREGGMAKPLATGAGAELFPRFSPDSTQVAFVGAYEGGRDLYTLPVGGGTPTRVTHHPTNEALADWTPDGTSLVFASADMGGLTRSAQLYRVPTTAGLPTRLPVPYGTNAALSKDGRWLAYTPHAIDNRTWKRYRGGMATDIWLYDLNDGTSKRVTEFEGLDSLPMWHGDDLYYLSDEGPSHRLNIWHYDTATGAREQVTKFEDFDVKWPAIGPDDGGPGEIVFQLGHKLMLLDLSTRQSREVPVQIPGNRPRIAAKHEDVSKRLGGWSISPTGKRVAVEARGDLWTLPAEHGSPRALVQSNSVAERTPAWSPDGKWIAFFDDSTGEYELMVMAADGSGEKRRLTTDAGPFKISIWWSPDSKWIAFADKTGTLRLVNAESAEVKVVDREPRAGNPVPSFSSDSAWIAYSRADDDNEHDSLWVYEIASGEKHRLTTGIFNDFSPVFSRNGDWIFFQSSRNFQPQYGDFDDSWVYLNSGTLMAMPLRRDVKDPWGAESDEEKSKEEKKKDDEKKKDEKEEKDAPPADDKKDDKDAPPADEKKDDKDAPPADDKKDDKDAPPADDKKDEKPGDESADKPTGKGPRAGGKDGAKDAPKPVKIDLEGIEARAFQLPIRAGRFGSMAVNDQNQLVYVRMGGAMRARGGGDEEEAGTGIRLLDLTDKKKEEKTIGPGRSFQMSADGKKLLVPAMGGGASIMDAKPGAKAVAVVTSPMFTRIDPRVEWRQIVHDAYRIMRDYFYEEGLHKVDWARERDRALALVEYANSREDLNFIIAEMISELNVGHAYLQGPGDVESTPQGPGVGLLGVDFDLVTDPDGSRAYRLKRIVSGAPWDADARNPLLAPGMDVKEGEFLLSVNGQPLDPDLNPWAAFTGLAGKPTVLRIGPNPKDDDQARTVVMRPISSENALRFRDWIERNRAFVAERSKGQVGYVYVPNTGVDGQTELYRQFQGNRAKAGLVIDERWNGGGQIPNRFIELLDRPRTNYWAVRDHRDWDQPRGGHHGPKAMLINGLAGSGGDMFPWLFKHHQIGPLVGTRTWGGLVGISGNPSFVDGGNISVPRFAFYKLDGTWGIEGHGVDPDYEVIDDPGTMKGGLEAGGRDPQLEKAVDLVLAELERNPPRDPPRPQGPDRRGMGLPERDR